MATTAAASSTSGGTSAPSTGLSAVEESADEVKVFRPSAQEDDPTELAGSSADLNADKQELAMEADIESQADYSQRVNPLFNSLGPLQWPSPGSNFLLNMAALSPIFQATHQKLAAVAMAQAYTAAATACIARLSPHYMNLGAGGPLGAAFERPPAFSMPCTPSSTNANRNGAHQMMDQMNSPMTALSGGLGGVSLSADRANAQRHHQQQRQSAASGHTKTPKREKAERREKQSSSKSVADDKKAADHIKKPMNAFMLFMKQNRHKYMDECGDKRKQSAELNKELGQIWQKMTRDEQQPYYEMAQQKREEHQRLYPNWTARENYAIHKRAKKRRTRERSLENNEQKKCRARFGVDNQAKWCKHCRRKKRCLNVRDSDSPVQVSSTTNPTTPLSMAGPSAFTTANLGGMFGHGGQDSPHSSRKDCGQSTNSELSRCSSTTSSTEGSTMSAEDGPPGRVPAGQQQKMEKNNKHNGFKMEMDTPKASSTTSMPTGHHPQPIDLPKPVPNNNNGGGSGLLAGQQGSQCPPAANSFQMPTTGGGAPLPHVGAGFPFHPFMPFGMNFGMPPFMKQ